MNYWLLKLRDGSIIRVKPDNVKAVQRSMTEGLPIHTPTQSIPISQIVSLEESTIRYTDQKLLEGAAQAFDEPLYNEQDSILARWVKKAVPSRKWHSYYSGIPSYRLLNDDGSHAMLAFKLPVHEINDNVEECSEADIQKIAS